MAHAGHLNGFCRSSQCSVHVISIVSQGHLNCFSRSFQLFLKVISVVLSQPLAVFWATKSVRIYNQLICNKLQDHLYFCKNQGERRSAHEKSILIPTLLSEKSTCFASFVRPPQTAYRSFQLSPSTSHRKYPTSVWRIESFPWIRNLSSVRSPLTELCASMLLCPLGSPHWWYTMSLNPALRSFLAGAGLTMRVPRWGTEHMMAGNRKNHIKFLSRMLGRARWRGCCQTPFKKRADMHLLGRATYGNS